MLLALPFSAAAWTPETQLAIAGAAASIAPPDLGRQIERHKREFQRGVLAPFEVDGETRHRAPGGGTEDLGSVLPREVERAVSAIRSHRPFAEVVFELGRISHLLADANCPLLSSDGDTEEWKYFSDYLGYVDSARERFQVVLYGGGRDLGDRDDVSSLLVATRQRALRLYPSVGEEYRRVGAIRGAELFDDRSTAFGVGAVAFSHAVSDVAAVLRYVWLRSGGADPRRLRWTKADPSSATGAGNR